MRLFQRGRTARQSFRSGQKVAFILKLGHGIPVTLRHMSPAELGVVALLNFYGIVKPFPKPPVLSLSGGGSSHFKFLQGKDRPLSRLMEQSLVVGTVVKKKGFIVHTAAEMITQQRQHTVFRPDLTSQHSLKFRKPNKAFEKMNLAVQMPYRLEQGQQGVIAELTEQRLSHTV